MPWASPPEVAAKAQKKATAADSPRTAIGGQRRQWASDSGMQTKVLGQGPGCIGRRGEEAAPFPLLPKAEPDSPPPPTSLFPIKPPPPQPTEKNMELKTVGPHKTENTLNKLTTALLTASKKSNNLRESGGLLDGAEGPRGGSVGLGVRPPLVLACPRAVPSP